MSDAAQPPSRSGLPILGPLSVIGRSALVLTVVTSLVAIVLDFGLHANETLIFIVAAAAILGLAWVVGLSTERLGSLTGPQVGGILNATFGNIAELIIAFFALQAGLIEVVKASLTGSIIGNLAEHLVSVQLAAKDKMEFAMAVTFGSSLQVALFVAPVLVLLGLVIGQPMNLVFTPLEIAAVAAAVAISTLIALDGESNWLEGALLMLVYAILAVSFYEFV